MTDMDKYPRNKFCDGCEYNIVSQDGLTESCDPPMNECPRERQSQRQVTPGLCIVNGQEAMRHFSVEDY